MYHMRSVPQHVQDPRWLSNQAKKTCRCGFYTAVSAIWWQDHGMLEISFQRFHVLYLPGTLPCSENIPIQSKEKKPALGKMPNTCKRQI